MINYDDKEYGFDLPKVLSECGWFLLPMVRYMS